MFNPTTGATSQTACQVCQAGRFGSAPGVGSCTECTPGKFSQQSSNPDDMTTCQLCAADTYLATSGATNSSQCQACPLSRPTSAPGSTSSAACITTNCPLGTYTLESDAPCGAACPPGSYCRNGQVFTCPAGTANSKLSRGMVEDCITCQPGSYGSRPGLTSCEAAPPGAYVDTQGSTSVELCGPGTYSKKLASTTSSDCISCPPEAPISQAGSTSKDQCTVPFCDPGQTTGANQLACSTPCPAGFYCLAGQKTPCEPGRYQPLTGRDSCLECGPGRFSLVSGATDNATCINCPRSTYSIASSGVCTLCTVGKQTVSDESTSSSDCVSIEPASCVTSTSAFELTTTSKFCTRGGVEPLQLAKISPDVLAALSTFNKFAAAAFNVSDSPSASRRLLAAGASTDQLDAYSTSDVDARTTSAIVGYTPVRQSPYSLRINAFGTDATLDANDASGFLRWFH